MAKVFVRSVTDDEPARWSHNDRVPAAMLRESAACDPMRVHQLVQDPRDADCVIFAENHEDTSASGPFLERVRSDRVYREHHAKCFVCSGLDHPVPFLPGVYPSIPRWLHRPWWTASGMYLAEVNPFLRGAAPASSRRYLASFLGTAKFKPAREALLQHTALDAWLVEDTHDGFIGALKRGDIASVLAYKRRAIDVSAQSAFVLCPRGVGPSSIRLFETMELGVAPVIIADDWVEPPGVAWSQCSLRVAEADIPRLPTILREHESRAEAMGRAARRAWEERYAPHTRLRTVVDACLAIASHPSFSRARGGRLALRAMATRPHLTRVLRTWKHRLRPRSG